jgi:hypothetical protein
MAFGVSLMRVMCFLLLCFTVFGYSARAEGSSRGSTHFPTLDRWELQEEVTVYTRENLWELIDGAADLFVNYAFEDLRVAEYRSPEGVDVRVELYRHTSRDMAFGMYAAERSPEFSFVSVGTQGYSEDGLLNFLSGKFYVKVSSHVVGKAGRDAMTCVGTALAKHLRQEEGWPTALSLLPQERRLPNSEGMSASNFLGYSFFPLAYTCRYDSIRGPQVFVIECATPAATDTLLAKYLQRTSEHHPEMKEGVRLVNDLNLGSLGIAKRGRYLGGVLPPAGATVDKSLLGNLDYLLAGAAAGK